MLYIKPSKPLYNIGVFYLYNIFIIMVNEKYVDKVLKHFIRGTKIDNEHKVIYFPFDVPLRYSVYEYLPIENINDFTGYIGRPRVLMEWADSFFEYIENQFGLTLEEMEYVYKNYILYIDKELGYL